MALKELWSYFHWGDKQNTTHWEAYCKVCVTHYQRALEIDGNDMWDASGELDRAENIFKEGEHAYLMSRGAFEWGPTIACSRTGKTQGDKMAMTAHILGGKGIDTCIHALGDAKAEAEIHWEALQKSKLTKDLISSKKRPAQESDTPDDLNKGPPKKAKLMVQGKLKAFNVFDMPFSPLKKPAIQSQTLRAIISANLSFRAFENPEVIKLFQMFRKGAAEVLPSGKVLSGRLLDDAAAGVVKDLKTVLNGRHLGVS